MATRPVYPPNSALRAELGVDGQPLLRIEDKILNLDTFTKARFVDSSGETVRDVETREMDANGPLTHEVTHYGAPGQRLIEHESYDLYDNSITHPIGPSSNESGTVITLKKQQT
jgi:hypothetical protein